MTRRAKKQDPAPEPRRGHPPMKFNKSLAEFFGVTPAMEAPENFREVVKVDSLPDPPLTEPSGAPAPQNSEAPNRDDQVAAVFREEAEEIGTRLARFGVKLHPSQKQDLADYGMALVSGNLAGGGAIARRR